MEKLRCGCIIKDGRFVVGENCAYCKECNAMAEMHPFGNKRLSDMTQ